jgi:hypothetical protein
MVSKRDIRRAARDMWGAPRRVPCGVPEHYLVGGASTGAPPPPIEPMGTPVEDDEPMFYPLTDETTDALAGANKLTVTWPITQSVEGTLAMATAAPTGSDAALNARVNGLPLLDNAQVIPAGTQVAPQQPAILIPQINQGDRVTFDLDAVGSTQAGRGYKLSIVGRRAGYTPLPVQAPVFNPLTGWPGLVFWVDPNEDSLVAEGANITQITDKVAGFAFVQDGALTLPSARNATSLNGRKSIPISTSILACTQAGARTPFEGVNQPFTVATLVRAGHNTSTRTAFGISAGSATADSAIEMKTSTAAFQASRADANANFASAGAGGTVAINGIYVHMAIFNGTELAQFINGVRVSVNAAAGLAGNITVGGVYLGANRRLAAPSEYWSNTGAGLIGDVLGGNQALAYTVDGSGNLTGGAAKAAMDFLRARGGV